MYYVLDVRGYECYVPHWFLCSCSKEEFEKEVAMVIDKSVLSLVKEDGFINGHDLLEKVIPILVKKGFKLIKPDHEVTVEGECLYNDRHNKPEIISDESWQKITGHNKKVRRELYRELKKPIDHGKKPKKS